MAKERIDNLLARKGLVESREKAKVLVLAGAVYVEGQKVPGPDKKVEEDARIEIRSGLPRYVSFGGMKLERALAAFGVATRGKTAVDIGASTGGFVDCLLQAGASKVYAVDVGRHQLHEKLRKDPRVASIEDLNARYLKLDDIGERVSIITVDVSFISLKKILPVAIPLLKEDSLIITLVKPQFEVGRYRVGKGGIVKDEGSIRQVIEEIKEFGKTLGLRPLDVMESPREKERKNREYFILWAL